MTYRQFIWGLSSGITILATAGAFWLTFGVIGGAPGILRQPGRLIEFGVGAGVCLAVLLVSIRRLRRSAAGFDLSELRRTQPPGALRRIRLWFLLVSAAQFVTISLLVTASVRAGRQDLIWPFVGLVLGLHFVPLAALFHVRSYYVLGVAVTGVSLLALGFDGATRTLVLGTGVGASFWTCAVYLLKNADRIARRAAAA